MHCIRISYVVLIRCGLTNNLSNDNIIIQSILWVELGSYKNALTRSRWGRATLDASPAVAVLYFILVTTFKGGVILSKTFPESQSIIEMRFVSNMSNYKLPGLEWRGTHVKGASV